MSTSLAMWWPSPEALKDLSVNDSPEGFELQAPTGSECASWLNYWDQSDEHRKFFQEQLVQSLLNYLDTLNGKTEVQPD